MCEATAGSALLALDAGAGSEKSSKSRRFGAGSGALALAGGGAEDVTGVVAERRGAGEVAEPLAVIEFDLRAATTSSSPASYSSKFRLEDESLKPPEKPPLLPPEYSP